MMGKLNCKNLILFIVGFCLYITIEVCFRGISYPVMGCVGGLSVVILDKLNDNISWNLDLFWQCLYGSCIITFFEFVIGEIMINTSILPVMWDYNSLPFNIDGIICLRFSLLWMFLSAVAIFIADAINYYVFKETIVPHYKLFGFIQFSFTKI